MDRSSSRTGEKRWCFTSDKPDKELPKTKAKSLFKTRPVTMTTTTMTTAWQAERNWRDTRSGAREELMNQGSIIFLKNKEKNLK